MSNFTFSCALCAYILLSLISGGYCILRCYNCTAKYYSSNVDGQHCISNMSDVNAVYCDGPNPACLSYKLQLPKFTSIQRMCDRNNLDCNGIKQLTDTNLRKLNVDVSVAHHYCRKCNEEFCNHPKYEDESYSDSVRGHVSSSTAVSPLLLSWTVSVLIFLKSLL